MSRLLPAVLAAVAAVAVTQVGSVPSRAQEPLPADAARAIPVFDPGFHTAAVTAMGFTTDNTKLVTVGEDYTVQVWNAATGERVDVLRLPGYGREDEAAAFKWDVGAVSADGTIAAVGGDTRTLAPGPDGQTRLVLIHIPTRKVVRVPAAEGDRVARLAFAPDGDALFAVTTGENAHLTLYTGVKAAAASGRGADLKAVKAVAVPGAPREWSVAVSRDGKRVLTGTRAGSKVNVWSATYSPPGLKKQQLVIGQDKTHGLAWSPDGASFVRSRGTGNGKERALEVWAADGTPIRTWPVADLGPGVKQHMWVPEPVYTAPGRVFATANTMLGPGGVPGLVGLRVDLATGKTERCYGEPGVSTLPPAASAASADRKLVAGLTGTGNEVMICRAEGDPKPVRCGNAMPNPFGVGWTADPAAPGFAWNETNLSGAGIAFRPTPADLRFGFDLTRVEPRPLDPKTALRVAEQKLGDWELVKELGGGIPTWSLKHGGDQRKLPEANSTGVVLTLVPGADGRPLVAHSMGAGVRGLGALALRSADDRKITQLLPAVTAVSALAASADGRFLIASTSSPRMLVYRTDGTRAPLFSFARVKGEWVLWTPEGYYAASPGGEKLFGWAVPDGPDKLVAFHPADRFAKHYRRPDVIRLAVEKGSVKAALEALNAKAAPEVDTILPPDARLALVAQQGARAKVRAKAEPRGVGKPILAMRVLLDGRPLPNGAGVWTTGPTESEFEVDIPPGQHELKLLARSADGSSVSDPVLVRGPKAAGPPQTLYRVCVGIDAYDQTGLKLATAAKDARDVFDALGRHCVGPDNRYAQVGGELVLDKDATRERVKKALEDTGRKAKPGDLMVVFFAGHGVKKGDAYYLLTRESDPAGDLKDKALSGDDLRAALAGVECPVLLALDACHSTGAVPTLRSAADDLTRALTDDAVGVTVLSAAMAHETAGASAGNGHFTAGLLKGLEAGSGVPFDPYERAVYVHHLYSVVFSEVRRATNGRQNPFLNMPWTAPPLAVRDVPP